MTELESLGTVPPSLTLYRLGKFQQSLSIWHLIRKIYRKIQSAPGPTPHPPSPNTHKEEAKLDHATGFSPLLTSKTPRLVAGDAEGSVRAGKPQCCG